MSNGHAVYQNSAGDELHLHIDVDLKSECIQDFYAKGTLRETYAFELEELKSLVLGCSLEEALKTERGPLLHEVRLKNGDRPLASLTLWLLHKAIEDYLGTAATLSEQNDLLCLCYGIGIKELKKQILARPDYDLPALVAETMATSACGSCRPTIVAAMQTIREEHGLILGVGSEESRLDKAGHWIKIKGLYPAELLIRLDDLKNNWMIREEIVGQFEIEILRIEGHHLWLKVLPADDPERSQKVLEALGEYWRSEFGALFFLHLV